MTTATRRLHRSSGSHSSVPQPPQGGADLLEQSPKRQRFAASSRRSGLGREVVVHWRELPEALGLTDREIVSFVGGGGKTTGLFALAATRSGPTVVTTTTKMGRDRTGGLPVLIGPSDIEVAAAAEKGSIIVWGDADENRATGVTVDACARYLDLVDTVVVEADGSRRRPFKAPLDYEPVVPPATTTLVACCGMAALYTPIREGCHRPERVAAIVGAGVEDLLTPDRLVQVLLSTEGSTKDRPALARFAVVLNRVRAEHADLVAEIRERIGAVDGSIPVVALDELTPAELPDVVG
ncbi:MAG: putative selenium-dependent hydroxylase accessory protein YqeC [Acidimicrobiaceae bacterium]|nr:putative selenium-dependent hydroxylase accessory protein YqeC [Acidimicrobiaceae bacterium]